MKTGDLVRHASTAGIALRKLQYYNNDDCKENWDGAPAWWVLFVDSTEPTWAYEIELTLVTEGN